MDERLLRLRAALDSNFGLVVAVLVVFTLVGGWLAYGAHVAPNDRVTTQQEVGSWEMAGAYEHRVTVTNGSDVFANGTTLENRTVYLQQASPTLDGEFRFDFASTVDARLEARAVQRLVLQQVTETDDQRAVVWERPRQLGNVSAELAPGQGFTLPFSFNATAIPARIESFNERLGVSRGQSRAVLVTVVRYEGEVDGRPVEGQQNYTAQVVFEGGTYRVVTSPERNRRQVTRLEAVEQPAGPLRNIGGPLLFLIGFLGVAGLTTVRAQGMLTVPEPSREAVRHDREREEFDEWITVADLPEALRDRPRASVADLEGLVDLAADTNSRVIEDPEAGCYYVAHDDILYVYELPGSDGPSTDGSQGSGE
jgi:hypothetical protein